MTLSSSIFVHSIENLGIILWCDKFSMDISTEYSIRFDILMTSHASRPCSGCIKRLRKLTTLVLIITLKRNELHHEYEVISHLLNNRVHASARTLEFKSMELNIERLKAEIFPWFEDEPYFLVWRRTLPKNLKPHGICGKILAALELELLMDCITKCPLDFDRSPCISEGVLCKYIGSILA